MPISPEKTIMAIEAYFKILQEEGRSYTHWVGRLVPLTEWEACRFFIGVMLDQRQSAKRAWKAAEEFVEKRNKKWSAKTFWEHFAEMNIRDLRKYCQFLPDGDYHKSYAGINAKKFPNWLRENAQKIVEEYEVAENIWQKDLPANNENKIAEIHKRFSDFAGIGENLANMATFSLVRDHGYFGGWKSRKFLKIKFDTHVNRVISKAILSGNPEAGDALSYVKVLNETLDSPADFDRALFAIGQDFCQYDDCGHCPIKNACNANTDNIVYELDSPTLQLEFSNHDPRCFEKFEIQSFELTYASANELNNYGATIICDQTDIKQFKGGITIQNNGFEAAIRLKDGAFTLSILKSDFFDVPLENIMIFPYPSANEALFTGQSKDINFFVKIDFEEK